MPAKNSQLKKKKDFELVFKKGRTIKNDFFVLKFLPNGLENNRFGIVVSQKVSKKAVVRNKIRRRVKESIKLKAVAKGENADAIIICFPSIAGKSFVQI